MIRIVHTHVDGTLIEGTAKGDGVFEIAKRHGFAYFPSIRAIGIRQSRDHVANRWKIDGLAKALREAGFEVTVDIDDEHRDRAEVLADQADRLDDRAEALAAKTARLAREAQQRIETAEAISRRFEDGQPILVGHHSERGARRDQERIDTNMRKAVQLHREATETGHRAAAVGTAATYSARPRVTARRIKTAEAELRKIGKALGGYVRNHLTHSGEIYYREEHAPATGQYRESLLARQAQLTDQVAYDKAALATAETAGTFTGWGRDNLHVGDLIRNGWGGWRTVAKLNQVTAGCESGYSWLDKVPYTDIIEVRCVHEEPVAEPETGGTLAAAGGDGRAVIVAEYRHVDATEPAPDPVAEALTAYRAGDGPKAAPAPCRADGYFATPPSLAAKLVAEMGPLTGTVLEPSAGDGSLVRAIRAANPDVQVVAVERNMMRGSLVTKGQPLDQVRLHIAMFEDFAAATGLRFDAVVMNPPFSLSDNRTVWIDHVKLAWDLLAPGGQLLAIVPAGFAFREDRRHREIRGLVDEYGDWQQLPAGSFAAAGTDVITCVIHLRWPVAGSLAEIVARYQS